MQLLSLISVRIGGQQPREAEFAAKRRDRDMAMDALAQIKADLAGTHTLCALATGFGVSERRLDKAFSKTFGMSVFQKLKSERMEAAKHILLNEDILLKQLSHRLGYSQVSNFVRAFTAHYGVPPKSLLRLENPHAYLD